MGICSSYGTYGSETGVIFWERAWPFNSARRGVIYCHGHGGFSWDYVNFPEPLLLALVRAGYPVIAPELAGTTSWGDDAAISAMTNANSQLQSALKTSATAPLIVCGSMGALPAFTWAKTNPVAAIVGVAPCVDLAYMHDNNVGGWQTEIETTFGGAAAYAAAVAAHNPAASPSSFASIPQRFYIGNTGGATDGVLPNSMQTTFASSSRATVIGVGNVSHVNMPAAVPTSDAVSFLLAHA